MTSFENYLISIGYKKHIFNTKTLKLEPASKHIISTMVNLDHRYLKGDIEIVFGLRERDKPLTLIHPRPRIKVIRDGGIEDEYFDDSMNVVLSKEAPEKIYNAMFDKNICFEYDFLTK